MNKPADHVKDRPRWYGQIPITITLAAAIGLLVLVAVSVVFGVGVWLAQNNTFDLLSRNAEQLIDADVNQFAQHLRPAESQTRFLAEMISDGEVDPDDKDKLGLLLTGSLAGAQQIEAVMFIDTQFQSIVARREPRQKNIELLYVDQSDNTILRRNLAELDQGPAWGPPVWRDQTQRSYLNRSHPVILHDEVIGAVVAVTSIEGLSNFISEHEISSGGNSFILYGENEVLAHWLLVDGYPGRSEQHPLPALINFGDPVLSAIWQEVQPLRRSAVLSADTYSHMLEIFNDRYAYVYRRVDGYGPKAMIIGAYFQANDSIKEIRRMIAALVAGIVALLLALLAAVFLGHRIARPIVRFSSAAVRIRDLDVAKIEELPGSVFRELNDQSIAFNSMLRALRWFEMYVPKKIVERLIRQTDVHDTLSDAREITVMFTDITGFSTISEGMQASEVAAFVNHHFSLVARCIEAQDGTIDKFIGDAVMAFWGAPDAQPDSALRACKAALAIGNAIREDNRQRKAMGQSPVAIRIGIHTGVATVGNIGAPGRFNYTLIGDVVNIGQRLEQLGKEVLSADSEVSILISESTAAGLESDCHVVAVGCHHLKGRSGEVEVYRLLEDTPQDSDKLA